MQIYPILSHRSFSGKISKNIVKNNTKTPEHHLQSEVYGFYDVNFRGLINKAKISKEGGNNSQPLKNAEADSPANCSQNKPLSLNKYNIELAQRLYTLKDVPKETLANLLAKTNKNNAQAKIEMLDFIEEHKEEIPVNNKTICEILEPVEPYNIELGKKMLTDGDFSQINIIHIMNYTKPHNVTFANRLVSDKDCHESSISTILLNSTKDNIDAKMEMYDFIKRHKEELGREYKYAIDSLHVIDNENIEIGKIIAGKENLQKSDMRYILKAVNKDNAGVAELLFKRKKISLDGMSKILDKVNENNIEFAKTIILDTEFPASKICPALEDKEPDDITAKKEMYDFVKRHKQELGEDYRNILGSICHVRRNNKELMERMIFDTDFPKSKTESVLGDSKANDETIRAAEEMYDFIEFNREYLGNLYKATLGDALQNINPENFRSKKRMYQYTELYQDDTRSHSILLAQVLAKTTKENEKLVKHIFKGVRKNKEKFESNYKNAVTKILMAIPQKNKEQLEEYKKLFDEYINKTKWNTNPVITELFCDIIRDENIENKRDALDYISRGGFDTETIKALKKQKYKVAIEDLQNSKDYDIVFKKSKDFENEGIGLRRIENFVRLKQDGKIIPSRCEIFVTKDGELLHRTHTPGGKNSCDIYYQTDEKGNKTLMEEIRIVNGASGPLYAQKIKASPIIKGVYDTVLYDINKENEDINIPDAIKNGKIKGIKTGRTYTEQDGTKVHTEKFFKGEYCTRRQYIENNDGTKKALNYVIENSGGEKLLDMKRFFSLKGNISTTTVNGKEYVAEFNDKDKTVEITCDNKKTKIDFWEKADTYSLSKLWDLLKKTPADSLLNYSEIPELKYSEKKSGWVYKPKGTIVTEDDLGVMAHELGHYKDATQNGLYTLNAIYKIEAYSKENWKDLISSDEELIKIYNEEIEQFKKDMSDAEAEEIDYFSQTGGSSGSGLSEMVAEINMLMTTQCASHLNARSMYLMRYFPRTIAKAAKLLGY